MAHRTAPIFVSIALGHASANAVTATAGGWSTGSSASLTFPLHSHMSSARREGSEDHFKSLWYDSAGARTHDLPVVRQTLYHWAITQVKSCKNLSYIYTFTYCLHVYRSDVIATVLSIYNHSICAMVEASHVSFCKMVLR